MFGVNFGFTALAARRRYVAFSPASYSGLIAWYDPSDLSTLFQDAAMTTPVTTDGEFVGAIFDKSGAENHLVQDNLSARPIYKTDGARHWLDFDGMNAFMKGTLPHQENRFVCMGVRYAGNGTVFYGGRSNSALRSYMGLRALSDFASGVGSDPTSTIYTPGSIVGLDAVVVMLHDGTTVKLRLDGLEGYVGNQNGTTLPGVASYLGALNNFGTEAYKAAFRFYGLVETVSVPTENQMTLCEAYISEKLGIFL
jgi:hypothetical protein